MNPTTDRTNVTTSGYTYGGKNYTYETRKDANNNPYQVAIESKAPTGQTSVSSPASTPTAVVSSNMAANDLNNRVLPGYNNIQSNVSSYNQGSSTNVGSRPGDNVYAPIDPKNPVIGPNNGLLGYRGYDGKTYQTQAEALGKKYQGGDGKYYMTQDEATLNTPATGHLYAYDQTGQRIEVPQGQPLPSGYSSTSPESSAPSSPAIETVNDSSGGSIRKLSDGTYGQYDNNGQFVGKTNELVYNNLKQANKIAQDLADMANGSFTLNDSEKAQIASLKAIYEKTIRDTQTQFANMSGSQAILQNLYGMGNNTIGQGAITGVITKGIQAVNDLNVEMEGKVAEMTQAFKDKDMERLKKVYDVYSQKETERQTAITKMKDDISLISRETKQQAETAANATDNDIRGLISVATQHGATPDQITKMQTALQNHDYTAAAEAGGDALLTASGSVGEFYSYQRDERNRGTPEAQIMSLNQYMTADANRKAKIAAAGATIMAGTDMTTKQQSIFNSIVEHQNKSPLVAANDRAVILKTITDEVSKDPSNAALQVSFIYSMIQALDTYQSAVREGEIGLISGTQGLGEKLNNLPSKIENGNPLNPNKIDEYVKVSKTLTDSISNATQQKKNTFRAQATVNGIGKQYDEWDTLTGKLNSNSIGGEHKENTKDDPLGVGTKGKTSTKNPLGI